MIISTESLAIKYLKELRKVPEAAVDTETYGVTLKGVEYSALQLNRARILTVQIYCEAFPALVFMSNKMGAEFLDFSKILPHMKAFLEDPNIKKVFHNANYDCNVFWNYGIRVVNKECTMIAGACQDENSSLSLKERAVLVGMLLKKTGKINFEDAADLADYGGEDAEATFRLKQYYFGTDARRSRVVRIGKSLLTTKPLVAKGTLQGSRKLFYDKQELPLLNIVMKMEHRGVRIDLKKLAKIHRKVDKQKTKHLKVVFEKAGRTFNINSNAQLQQVLFDELNMHPVDKSCYTAKGAPSTNARSLQLMSDQHPVVEHLIEVRKLEKLQGVYTNPVSGLPFHCDADGFIHATANNVGTHTFRFSYSNPNLQTIPSKRDTFGIRGCFVAPEGFLVAVFDYSQIEVRIQAIFSRDKIMVEELSKDDGDVYLRTAREFGSRDPKDDRQMYKIIALALQYGMGPWKLSDQLTMSGYPTNVQEAKARIDTYLRVVYAGIPVMWDDLFQEHALKGHVTTLFGRPRKVKDFAREFDLNGALKINQYERALVNNVMQGSAADFIKQAMLRLDKSALCRKLKYRMLLQIHDELLGIIPEKYADEFQGVMDIATEIPKAPFAPTREICVPMRAEGGTGESWMTAKG